jgi:hypothetical protein
MKKIIIPAVIVLVVTSIGGYYGLFKSNQILSADRETVVNRVNDLFDGKESILDGQKIVVVGSFADSDKKKFDLDYGSGFNIYKLDKVPNGYIKSEYTAGDLSYEKAETMIDYSWGYSYKPYRPSVDDCYDNIYLMLTRGNEKIGTNTSYSPNKFETLKGFPENFKTDYHSIVTRPTPANIDSYSSNYGGNDTYRVSYTISKTYYEIYQYENNSFELKRKNIIFFSLLGFAASITLVLLFVFIRPSHGKYKILFRKKWKNTTNNSILIISKNLLGPLKITIIEDGKSTNGRGILNKQKSTIEFSFKERVYFYKINLLSDFKFELVNQVNNEITTFELLGI